MSGKAWYESFFDETYDWLHARHERRTAKREAEAAAKLLALRAGQRLLDVPCGAGRHALHWARMGVRVTGVDASARRLRQAREAAGSAGLAIAWWQADMRDLRRLFAGADFDAVACMFNSFGYFGDADDQGVLDGMVAALKPGGRLLLDLPNRDHLLRHAASSYHYERERHWVLVSFRFDHATQTAEMSYTFVPKDGAAPPLQRTSRMRWYAPEEIEAMATRAGAHVIGLFGDLNGRAFTDETDRMVVLAVREEATTDGDDGGARFDEPGQTAGARGGRG